MAAKLEVGVKGKALGSHKILKEIGYLPPASQPSSSSRHATRHRRPPPSCFCFCLRRHKGMVTPAKLNGDKPCTYNGDQSAAKPLNAERNALRENHCHTKAAESFAMPCQCKAHVSNAARCALTMPCLPCLMKNACKKCRK